MIMDFKAVAATLNPFEVPGKVFQFTLDNFNSMAASAIGLNVCYDFDPVKLMGLVTDSFIEFDKLVIIARLDVDRLFDFNRFFIVPSINLADYTSREYGLTKTPADKSLRHLEPVLIKGRANG